LKRHNGIPNKWRPDATDKNLWKVVRHLLERGTTGKATDGERAQPCPQQVGSRRIVVVNNKKEVGCDSPILESDPLCQIAIDNRVYPISLLETESETQGLHRVV
jgi:hypothetical protein